MILAGWTAGEKQASAIAAAIGAVLGLNHGMEIAHWHLDMGGGCPIITGWLYGGCGPEGRFLPLFSYALLDAAIGLGLVAIWRAMRR